MEKQSKKTANGRYEELRFKMPKIRNILVVEDDGGLRGLLKDQLETKRYSVRTCDGALEVRDNLESGYLYDLALIDRIVPYETPGGVAFSPSQNGGDELIKELRKEFPSQPIISISCGNFRSPEASMHLAKPFSVPELLRAIKSFE